jgi:6-pyruvoyltetrahydropterin/6-carboxytetrahydropterin synthase
MSLSSAHRPYTCTKRYENIPFAHRQWHHSGLCSKIHGHSWTIELTFSARSLDARSFVVDFGSLDFIKDWIQDNLDHACVLAHDDPLVPTLNQHLPQAFKLYLVGSPSCEGIAQHLWETFAPRIGQHTQDRAQLVALRVCEDRCNQATYFAPHHLCQAN